MATYSRKQVPMIDILLDPENPRFDPIQHQREALANQLHPKNRSKLLKLAEDIVRFGTDPSQLPIVTEEIRNNQTLFLVREGNRRVAALQLLNNPKLAASIVDSGPTRKKLDQLAAKFEENPINEVECVVFEAYDTIPRHWIKLKHTGENSGAGVVLWNGKAAARFSGGSIGLQAIELVLNNVELSPQEREAIIAPNINVTTIDRMLLTPADARKLLGFDLVNGNLTVVDNSTRAMSNLAQLVLEVANRNLTSRKLNKSSDRIAEAERIARSAPKRKLSPVSTIPTVTRSSLAAKTQQGSKQQGLRKTVATRQKILISEPRIKDIYHELQHLKIDNFPNAAAILIRVFFELSIDDYAKPKRAHLDFQLYDKNKKPVKDRQIRFQEKVLKVINHMRANGVSRQVTAQAQSMATNPDKLFYFERLHDYIHNPHYAPLKADLPKIWDNLQAFAEALWK